ncbi:MAG: nucleoside-diphosphate kinase [Kiritimatiellales bacterium]|nr:nucleoside-diphosphate kinase [Kiritimatiellota bacterium]MBL7012080.1 nucleoside-diphosphate kinase [Kiritimatiellales bacterium]
MAKELGFVLITPHSLRKSRTGGIIGRFSRIEGLEFVASRMFGPSQKLVEEYAELLRNNPDISEDKRNVLADYVLRALTPEPGTGRPHRAMLLLFEGENAIQKIYETAGSFDDSKESADTVRGTHGEYVRNHDGELIYFEPAVLVAPSAASASRTLALWMKYAETDGGIVSNALSLPEKGAEKTLVIIKPDNFRFPSSRPGNIIDLFSRSGLRIIGAQVHRMSMAEAKEFYGPVQAVLREKLADRAVSRALSVLKNEFDFDMPDDVVQALNATLGPDYGDNQFYEIMQFMTGLWLPDVPEAELDADGTAHCLVLIYAGENAVEKIRTILGPTDPSKALPGSVRKEYGSDIMVNAAHASDSPENALREMGILKPERNALKKWFELYYG